MSAAMLLQVNTQAWGRIKSDVVFGCKLWILSIWQVNSCTLAATSRHVCLLGAQIWFGRKRKWSGNILDFISLGGKILNCTCLEGVRVLEVDDGVGVEKQTLPPSKDARSYSSETHNWLISVLKCVQEWKRHHDACYILQLVFYKREKMLHY